MRARDEKYQYGEPPTPASLGDDVIISPDTLRDERLPPRQVRTRKWPVLDAHGPPSLDRSQWTLEITGLVERPTRLDWDAFQRQPRIRVFADFHCVTRWSRLGNLWEGVAARPLLEAAGIRPEARFVILHAYDDQWTTNLPLDDFLAPDVILADTHDGQPLSLEHGGPVRAVVPRLYAWKSAKWLKTIELAADDRPGYWEQAGYHARGDPWREQRFANPEHR